jgi:hypothetical protein
MKCFSRIALLGVALVLAVAGCAAEGVRRDADGTITIDCGGGYHDWSVCYSRADRACGSAGFDILSRVSNEGSEGVGTRDWSARGSEVSRRMVLRCR